MLIDPQLMRASLWGQIGGMGEGWGWACAQAGHTVDTTVRRLHMHTRGERWRTDVERGCVSAWACGAVDVRRVGRMQSGARAFLL